MYFLGVENGLERTRSVVLNLETALVEAEAVVQHEFVEGLPVGHREQDPAQWIRSVDQTVRQCLEHLGDGRKRVVGIGVGGHPRAPVLLDRAHRIIRPTKLGWDRSTGRQDEELGRAFGGSPGMIELTGNTLEPGSVAARILWLKQNEPHHFQRLAMVMMPHDFINYWLTGVNRTEFSEAAQTGLLDVRVREWSGPLAEYVDPGFLEMLPPVRSSREPHALLRGELARGWGLSEDLPVSAGGSLAMMEVMGAGSVTPGSVTVTLAPVGRVALVCDEARVDPLGEIATGCDLTDRWLATTQTIQAAGGLDQVRRHYGWDGAQMREAMMAARDGSGGLLLLPGSRRAGHEGVLYGLDGGNFRPENVARAGLEALLLEMSAGLERMRSLGVEPEMVRMTGGGAADGELRQLVADVCGLPVLPLRGDPSAALGAALQAALSFFHQSGEDLSYAEITSYVVEPDESQRCEPNQRRYQFYQDLLGRQRVLSEALRGERWSGGDGTRP